MKQSPATAAGGAAGGGGGRASAASGGSSGGSGSGRGGKDGSGNAPQMASLCLERMVVAFSTPMEGADGERPTATASRTTAGRRNGLPVQHYHHR